MKVYLNNIAVIFLVAISTSAIAKGNGFLDFNAYPHLTDVDSDSVFTLNVAYKLPSRLSYFSLSNVIDQTDNSNASDDYTYYSEQNLRWQIAKDSPLDLTIQLNFRSGDNNDRQRIGVRWRLNNTSFLAEFFKSVHLNYSVNWHFVQFDHEGPNVWQLEHVLSMKFPYISDRLYLAAFADHTFNQDLPTGYPSSPIVAEAQLGFRLIDNLFLVTEYRLNQYRRSDVNNLALGIQYKLPL